MSWGVIKRVHNTLFYMYYYKRSLLSSELFIVQTTVLIVPDVLSSIGVAQSFVLCYGLFFTEG